MSCRALSNVLLVRAYSIHTKNALNGRLIAGAEAINKRDGSEMVLPTDLINMLIEAMDKSKDVTAQRNLTVAIIQSAQAIRVEGQGESEGKKKIDS